MEKPSICPQCQNPKRTLWHNLKLSPKDNAPYENHKCACGYLKWETKEIAKEHYDLANGIAPTAPNKPSVVSEPQGREIVLLERLERMEKKIDLLLQAGVKDGRVDINGLEF